MKQNKTILLLMVVLLVLVGLLALRTTLPWGTTDKDAYTQRVDSLSPEAVTTIAIGDEPLTFFKEGDTWRVHEYMADGKLVQDLLAAILTPDSVKLVSESDARHEELGVASDSGTLVRLNPDGEHVAVVVGESAVGGRYVRFLESATTYLVSDVPMEASLTTTEDWVDRTIVRIPESQIEAIEILGTEEVALAQREGAWYQAGSETALDTTNLSSLFTTLTAFTTQGLTEEPYEGRPMLTVRVLQTQQEALELSFYPSEEENMALVTSSQRAGVYRISELQLEHFQITGADLKERSEPETE